MNSNENVKVVSTGGIGLLGWTFVVFLALKLAGIGPVASWSWWAVTAPLWIPLALVVAICLALFLGFLFFCVGCWIKDTIRKRQQRCALCKGRCGGVAYHRELADRINGELRWAESKLGSTPRHGDFPS